MFLQDWTTRQSYCLQKGKRYRCVYGKGIGGFISGILKGIGAGLTAIANPVALIGLGAVPAAILAISAALRIVHPTFEPIGKLMEVLESR